MLVMDRLCGESVPVLRTRQKKRATSKLACHARTKLSETHIDDSGKVMKIMNNLPSSHRPHFQYLYFLLLIGLIREVPADYGRHDAQQENHPPLLAMTTATVEALLLRAPQSHHSILQCWCNKDEKSKALSKNKIVNKHASRHIPTM